MELSAFLSEDIHVGGGAGQFLGEHRPFGLSSSFCRSSRGGRRFTEDFSTLFLEEANGMGCSASRRGSIDLPILRRTAALH